MNNKDEAYKNFRDHLKQWELFLEEATNLISDLDDDNVGEFTKKDRQLNIITNVLNGAVCNPRLLQDFIYPEGSVRRKTVNVKDVDWIQKNLDKAQKEAVARSIQTDTLCFIQGPPGTGKTTVITEICLQLLKINPLMRILVCSETHVAVDNLIEKFYKLEQEGKVQNLNCIRVYSKDKADSEYRRRASVDYHIDEYIKSLHSSCVGDNIAEELMRLFMNNEKAVNKELMLSADIVGVTCNSLAKINFSADESFDYVIFDEVCKATLPEILIPLSLSKRAILVGDPKQLPPVFLQEDKRIMDCIDNCRLDEYMYIDNLFARLGDDKKKFLENQYRMTNEIGNIISKYFYDSMLKNGRKISIKDSIIWCDYMPSKQWGSGEGSPFNFDEIEIVKKILSEQDAKAKKFQVAVISPYKGQNRELRNAIDVSQYKNLDIDIDTIDSFQGKDADIVIFCITRSTGSLRFFSNPRRLNVALSRAKDLCCIIGYSKFATNNKTLQDIYYSIKHVNY
ncbi:MAG: AAA domain-containing protein [Candidatus Coproplasma sp.]